MTLLMKGFAMRKTIHDGDVKETGILGEYDGHEAHILSLNNGEVSYKTLTNRDIQQLVSLPASSFNLDERLEKYIASRTSQNRRKKRRKFTKRRKSKSHKPYKRKKNKKTNKKT